jgi:signal transduction histidine kinase
MPPQARSAVLKAERPASAAPPGPALDSEKLSFLRMLGHELRTPLNSIIGFSEIIERELYGPVGQPRYREHAEIVRRSGQKLLRLVDQVMEIVRLDAGAAHLDMRPEPLEPIIAEALRLVGPDAHARDVRLASDVARGTPLAVADARALRTVLVNLLQNAVNASPAGGEVRLDAAPDGEDVLIRVKDHGQGVDPGQIPRLMRPFEQGENPLTRHVEGAGLGLPIVKLLCAAMDGRVRLRSRPGEGLTAYVQLPAAVEDASHAA